MSSIRVTDNQKRVLDILDKEDLINRGNISEKTGLKRKSVERILQALMKKGLVKENRRFGPVLYSLTHIEFISNQDSYYEKSVLLFLEANKRATRNLISIKLNLTWKRTVKLLLKMEEKGLIKKFKYRNINIYSLND